MKNQKISKSIAIFGGGVGGLTVAHDLSKFPEYTINLYEKKAEIGGLARSGRDNDGCATEYCWRVYFGFYGNLLKILREIPLIENKNKSVFENLTPYNNINLTDRKTSLKDQVTVAYKVIYGFTACDARLDEMDKLTWWQGLGSLSSSNLYREIGAWLGMDRLKGSFKSVIKVGMEMHYFSSLISRKYRDKITSKPTSEAWFLHWQKYLAGKKVEINFGSELRKLNFQNNKIVSAEVWDGKNKKINKIVADEYILSIPIEALAALVEKTPELQRGDLNNSVKLRNLCLHTQLAFQVFFDRKISLGTANSFLLIDSAWDLIVLSYDQAFSNTKLANGLPKVKGAWSVAACTAYTPGIVFGKPMNKCSYEEIVVELWAQIEQSKSLEGLIEKNNNFKLTKEMVIKWAPMWPTYFTNKKGELETSEPKFTNNAGSYALRPSFRTPIENLYISTAYVKETVDVFSMEAAAFSGKSVAMAVEPRSDLVYIKQRPRLFLPFRWFDTLLYKCGLPNLNPVALVGLLLLGIITSTVLLFANFNF